MVLSWMLYILVTSTLAGAAASLAERSCRLRGLPGRWAWIASFALSLALPPVAWVAAGTGSALRAGGPAEAVGKASVGAVAVVGFGVGQIPAWLATAEQAALPLWAGTSLLLLLLLAGAGHGLRRARRGWPRLEAGQVPVRVSPDLGPAVLGFLRPVVVLPRWVAAAGEDVRSWILAHESEHIRARDPLLLLLGLAGVVLLPWNVALWWQLRRLRLAVELDCDARVLRDRGSSERLRYGGLLLEVGRRSGTRSVLGPGLLAGFSEGPSFLERRIRAMTDAKPRHPLRRAGLLVAAGALLVAGACMVPEPDRPTLTGPEVRPASPAAAEDLGDAPVFTPYTQAPVLLNQREVREALQREYPPILREAGIGGRAEIFSFIDATGAVKDARIEVSTGHDPLDAAALRVARTMRFRPAMNRDETVPVWIKLPISFALGDREESGRAAPVSAAPTATPYTTAPSLQNVSEVREVLAATYPDDLREAGVSGRALVYFFLDEQGAVRDARINRSSGEERLDRAALDVARSMRFTPALNRDEAVPVWISLPITFEAR